MMDQTHSNLMKNDNLFLQDNEQLQFYVFTFHSGYTLSV